MAFFGLRRKEELVFHIRCLTRVVMAKVAGHSFGSTHTGDDALFSTADV